jgi:hypothetical protein
VGQEPTTVLYRPVGRAEYELIRKSQFREFPPRLTGQPIFYPAVTKEYAAQMARDWNAKDKTAGYAGFVTSFRVDSAFLSKYEVHRVGDSQHLEYWIPAEDLEAFNENIRGPIEIVAEYHGVPDDAA